MSSLTLLGTGTCQIEHQRRASSVLLELDGLYILFDCGRGIVQRLLDAGVRHNQVDHIVISHFHPDHVSDLIPFLHAGAWSRRDPRSANLHIYGPPGVQQFMHNLLGAFRMNDFFPPSKAYAIQVHEISEEQITIGPHSFEFLSLPPSGNHGLRFNWGGKRYAITGDSWFHAQEVAFLINVDLAIIDAGHIEDDEIVELAATTQAGHIVCSHLYRDINAPQLLDRAREKGFRGHISVGCDLQTFAL